MATTGLTEDARTGPNLDLDRPLGRGPDGTDEAAWHPHLVAAPELEPGPPGRLLVVAAHPHDEVLAVGGLVADLAAAGWRIAVVTVTDGRPPGVDGRRPSLAARRTLDDAHAVALGRLGVPDIRTDELGLPAGRLEARCEQLINVLAPHVAGSDLCVVPLDVDGHRDHEVVGRVARALADDLGVPTAAYPLWAWRRATPDALPFDRLRAWSLSMSTWLAKRHAMDACTMHPDGLATAPGARATFLRPFEILAI
jgi:LmbE family N-acetylglucosaminyl deacetylase